MAGPNSIPPNLGGPSPYQGTTTFQSQPQPIKTVETSQPQPIPKKDTFQNRKQESSPVQISQEQSKENNEFEHLLSEAKEKQTVNHSIEETGDQHESKRGIPIQHPSKKAIEEEQDELFKSSPDSFFGVDSVENVAQRILELGDSTRSREPSIDKDPGRLLDNNRLLDSRCIAREFQRLENQGAFPTEGDSKVFATVSSLNDPVPLKHKMMGAEGHDIENLPAGESPEASYGSRFKMWPSNRESDLGGGMQRTDSSDLLEDARVENAVNALCEDLSHPVSLTSELSTNTSNPVNNLNQSALSIERRGSGSSQTDVTQRCSVEATKKSTESDSQDSSLATFVLPRNNGISVDPDESNA